VLGVDFLCLVYYLLFVLWIMGGCEVPFFCDLVYGYFI